MYHILITPYSHIIPTLHITNYVGFNDRISHGGWLSGPRTATMPYGTTSNTTAGARSEEGSFNSMTGLGLGAGAGAGLGEGFGSGGLALPRGTPNPFTLGHPLSGNVGLGSSFGSFSSSENNHYPF